jgi:hypothetical protein
MKILTHYYLKPACINQAELASRVSGNNDFPPSPIDGLMPMQAEAGGRFRSEPALAGGGLFFGTPPMRDAERIRERAR